MRGEMFFLGLTETGASVGLALADAGVEITRTGYDEDRQLAAAARKAGAVDQVAANPERAARTADLILLTLPTDDAGAQLAFLAPRLKEGAVLIDAVSPKTLARRWITEHLPEGRHYIGATLVPQAEAPAGMSAERFRGGLMALVIPPETPDEVFGLVVGLASRLDIHPFFLEAEEADSAVLGAEGLPALLGAAQMRATAAAPGWRETQRLAGPSFAARAPLGEGQSPAALAASLTHDPELALAKIDAFLTEVQSLRALIAQGDASGVAERLENAQGDYQAWLDAWRQGDWAQALEGKPDLPDTSLLRQLFGFGRRPSRSPSADERQNPSR